MPKSKSKVLTSKGRKHVGALTFTEGDQTTTVELCFNAVGTYMVPMFIFPRQRMMEELMDGAPGAWAECQSTLVANAFHIPQRNYVKLFETEQIFVYLPGVWKRIADAIRETVNFSWIRKKMCGSSSTLGQWNYPWNLCNFYSLVVSQSKSDT